MLGLAPPAPRTPSFWSDQHGIRIHHVGHAGGADAVHVDGRLDGRELTATYTDRGRPVAALLVGRPSELPAGRRRIEQARLTDPERSAA
jgi:hypothetical protein